MLLLWLISGEKDRVFGKAKSNGVVKGNYRTYVPFLLFAHLLCAPVININSFNLICDWLMYGKMGKLGRKKR